MKENKVPYVELSVTTSRTDITSVLKEQLSIRPKLNGPGTAICSELNQFGYSNKYSCDPSSINLKDSPDWQFILN